MHLRAINLIKYPKLQVATDYLDVIGRIYRRFYFSYLATIFAPSMLCVSLTMHTASAGLFRLSSSTRIALSQSLAFRYASTASSYLMHTVHFRRDVCH